MFKDEAAIAKPRYTGFDTDKTRQRPNNTLSFVPKFLVISEVG